MNTIQVGTLKVNNYFVIFNYYPDYMSRNSPLYSLDQEIFRFNSANHFVNKTLVNIRYTKCFIDY